MSKDQRGIVVTEAKPHTIKKFELIEAYVDEWARKILGFQGKDGHSGSKGIIYIDCMCNSGVYKDDKGHRVEGSALRVAKCLNTIIPNYPGKNAILLFNDKDSARVERLEAEIQKAGLKNIRVHYYHEDCDSFLRGLDLKGWQQSHNTLLLYDPYNAAINWDAVTPYLNQWGEVIFNHMVFDTSRGAAQAKKQEVICRYQSTYQQDIDSIIRLGNNKDALNQVVIDIINQRRNRKKAQHYIASFPFFNRTNGLVYNIIYCSYSRVGYRLFKKVAWKTFGDRSSLKTTHEDEGQLMIPLNGQDQYEVASDDECFYVSDIAKYVYDKFAPLKTVQLQEIYDDLDLHPIFPTDGYKEKIKDELKTTYGVTFHKSGKVDF